MIIVLLLPIVFIVILLKVTIFKNFQCTSKKCLIGKVAIVTGGNSGMGNDIVRDLASRGCKVILADVVNGEKIAAQMRNDTGNPNIFWKSVDLSSLVSVREFVEDIKKTETRLDILINNAGCSNFRTYTEDGLQKVMQVNYFGHYLLSHLLVDLLKKTENSRIVSVSSLLAFVHSLSSADLINVMPTKMFMDVDHIIQYANSKLCLVIAMKLMAEKLKKHKILCYSVEPGFVATPIFETSLNNSNMKQFYKLLFLTFNMLCLFLVGKTSLQGAQATLDCALSEEIEHLSGKYFSNGKAFWEPPAAKDPDFCIKIWNESERLVKLTEAEKLK